MTKLNLYVEGYVRPETTNSPFYRKLYSLTKENTSNKVIIYIPDTANVPIEIRELGKTQRNISWLGGNQTAASTNVVVTSKADFVAKAHERGYSVLFILDEIGHFSPEELLRFKMLYDVHCLTTVKIFEKSGIDLFRRDDIIILLNSTSIVYSNTILPILYLLDEENQAFYQKLMEAGIFEQPFFNVNTYLFIVQNKPIRALDGITRKPGDLTLDSIVVDKQMSSEKKDALEAIGERIESSKEKENTNLLQAELKNAMLKIEGLENVVDKKVADILAAVNSLAEKVDESNSQSVVAISNEMNDNPFLDDDPLLGFRNNNEE